MILLDVVMEKDNSGLEVVSYIRSSLKMILFALFYALVSQVNVQKIW
jgi:hypothetical protein